MATNFQGASMKNGIKSGISSVFWGILAAILQCNGRHHRNVKNVIATWRDRNMSTIAM